MASWDKVPARLQSSLFLAVRDGWFLCMAGKLFDEFNALKSGLCVCIERQKGIRWMPWHQEAMKDVARCEKPWGGASTL